MFASGRIGEAEDRSFAGHALLPRRRDTGAGYMKLRTAAPVYAQEKDPDDAHDALPSLLPPEPHEDAHADSWISFS